MAGDCAGAASEAEARLFPPPPAVDFWLQPAEDLERYDDRTLASQARDCLEWLERALRDMYKSARVKAAVGDLLNVSDFTCNLSAFGVFDDLRSFCQAAADELGLEMKLFYETARLGESLGRFQVRKARDPLVLRQDAPEVGVPVPPCEAGRTPLQQENVALHMLILIARALDPGFQDIIVEMVKKHHGRHRAAPTKGHARMMNKAVAKEDHRFKAAPVVMHNIDLVRCAVTFDEVEDLTAMLNSLEDAFGAPARDKNMFAYGDSKAAAQLHYRTFMRNLVYAPKGLTYGRLAERHGAMWKRYMESPPEDPNEPWARFRADSARAVKILRSAAVADRPVRLVCEVQCLLQKYLDGRLKMHGLYKVMRAPDPRALYGDFKRGCASYREGTTWTDVQEQAFEEVCRRVDGKGEDVNSPSDEVGMTMLLHAAVRGQVWAARWLLGRRADVHAVTRDDGATALFLAAENGHFDTVQVLLAQRADVDRATTSHRTSPLSMAASHGDIDVAQVLLAARANANAPRDDGLTPLWQAVHGGHMDVAQALLDAAADVNRARPADACTPLLVAAQYGYTDVVGALLAAGADARGAKKDDGVAPLGMAAFRGHDAVAQALLLARADADAATHEGKTPLYLAAENGHVLVAEALLAGAAAVDRATPDDGTSPLYVAAQNGHVSVVRALLSAHAAVDQATTNDGATPLWAAAECGHAETTRLLLGGRANADQGLASDESTPLLMAAHGGHAEVVRALLEGGADPGRPCGDFGTALESALDAGHEQVVELLEAA